LGLEARKTLIGKGKYAYFEIEKPIAGRGMGKNGFDGVTLHERRNGGKRRTNLSLNFLRFQSQERQREVKYFSKHEGL